MRLNERRIGEKILGDWVPSIVIGIALIVFAVYLFISKNITALIGMQVIYLKTAHSKVANISAIFLLVAGILTVLVPLANMVNGVAVAINLFSILLTVLLLFFYLYKQKIK